MTDGWTTDDGNERDKGRNDAIKEQNEVNNINSVNESLECDLNTISSEQNIRDAIIWLFVFLLGDFGAIFFVLCVLFVVSTVQHWYENHFYYFKLSNFKKFALCTFFLNFLFVFEHFFFTLFIVALRWAKIFMATCRKVQKSMWDGKKRAHTQFGLIKRWS